MTGGPWRSIRWLAEEPRPPGCVGGLPDRRPAHTWVLVLMSACVCLCVCVSGGSGRHAHDDRDAAAKGMATAHAAGLYLVPPETVRAPTVR